MQIQRAKNCSGLTFIELVIAMAILAILASVVLPLSEVTVTRTKELELRRNLRDIRSAIDAYKHDYDQAVAEKKIFATVGKSGYPERLETLLEGNDWGGLYPFKKKYLRRIPRDPFDRDDLGWGLRSYIDEADSSVWGGEDVYDVYSQNENIALDGSAYRDW